MSIFTGKMEFGEGATNLLNMQGNKKVFVDSDAFIALLYEPDLLHQDAVRIFKNINAQSLMLCTSNTVIAETATVLSNRVGQSVSRAFLNLVQKYSVLFVGEDTHKETLELFSSLEKKGMSYVDCSNVVVMRENDISIIFSFDGFYKSQSGIDMPREAGLI